jgi:hypothetical protein
MRPTSKPELDTANYEDLLHLTSLWSMSNLTNADIRRSSNIVRRLLHYKEIVNSSAPRSLRLTFNAPDNKALVRASANGHLDFFQSAGTTVMGLWFRASTVSRNDQQLQASMAGFDPDAVIELRLESFLDQPVFSFLGQQISRRSVILYVANKAAGTHFDEDRPSEFSTLDRIRSAVSIKLVDGIPSFGFDVSRFDPAKDTFIPSGSGIDPVFIELAATIRYFTESPSVKVLINLLAPDAPAEASQETPDN